MVGKRRQGHAEEGVNKRHLKVAQMWPQCVKTGNMTVMGQRLLLAFLVLCFFDP